jgi:hypothetical protein
MQGVPMMLAAKPQFRRINECLVCGRSDLRQVLSLGHQPLANLFLDQRDQTFARYPLVLDRCTRCAHGQLAYSVDPDELFHDYAYASGTSSTLNAFFEWLAQDIALSLKSSGNARPRVLEIACNDGSLLGRLAEQGLETHGVDPDTKLSATARALPGVVSVTTDFWPCRVPTAGKDFDMIVALNVLAHVPTPLTFLEAVREALSPSGVCLVQVSQGNMLLDGQFDAIYHEHLSYFTPQSMNLLCQRVGLRICRALRTNIHGGSDAYLLQRLSASKRIPASLLSTQPLSWAKPLHQATHAAQIDIAVTYDAFVDRANARMDFVKYLCSSQRKLNKTLVFVGAAAKAIVVLHATGIIPDAILDEAPLKIGKFVPGLGVAVESLNEAWRFPDDTLFVISAWNYLDELRGKLAALRPGRRTRIAGYFPKAFDMELTETG